MTRVICSKPRIVLYHIQIRQIHPECSIFRSLLLDFFMLMGERHCAPSFGSSASWHGRLAHVPLRPNYFERGFRGFLFLAAGPNGDVLCFALGVPSIASSEAKMNLPFNTQPFCPGRQDFFNLRQVPSESWGQDQPDMNLPPRKESSSRPSKGFRIRQGSRFVLEF